MKQVAQACKKMAYSSHRCGCEWEMEMERRGRSRRWRWSWLLAMGFPTGNSEP